MRQERDFPGSGRDQGPNPSCPRPLKVHRQEHAMPCRRRAAPAIPSTMGRARVFSCKLGGELLNDVPCPGGETGIRKGLKIPRTHVLAGSIPAPGTMPFLWEGLQAMACRPVFWPGAMRHRLSLPGMAAGPPCLCEDGNEMHGLAINSCMPCPRQYHARVPLAGKDGRLRHKGRQEHGA